MGCGRARSIGYYIGERRIVLVFRFSSSPIGRLSLGRWGGVCGGRGGRGCMKRSDMEIILLVKYGGISLEACVFNAFNFGKVQVRMARTGWSAAGISWI